MGSFGAMALNADTGGTIEINGKFITYSIASGISASNNSSIKLDDAEITVNVPNSIQFGIRLKSDSTLTVNKNLTVTDNSSAPTFTSGRTIDLKSGSQLHVDGKLTVNTISHAVETAGANTSITMGSGEFNSTNSAGLVLTSSSGSSITSLGDVAINASGKSSIGILASTDGTISIHGNLNSITDGEAIHTSAGQVNLNTADILLTGGNKNTSAIRAIQGGKLSSSGNITIDATASPSLYGILAKTQGDIKINGHLESKSSGTGIAAVGDQSSVYAQSANITTWS